MPKGVKPRASVSDDLPDTEFDREVRARIAAWVKAIRERVGETQEQMAQQLGVGQPYLSRVERNEQPVQATFAARFCKIYGVDPLQLFNKPPASPDETKHRK